jgi:hypothetical protein
MTIWNLISSSISNPHLFLKRIQIRVKNFYTSVDPDLNLPADPGFNITLKFKFLNFSCSWVRNSLKYHLLFLLQLDPVPNLGEPKHCRSMCGSELKTMLSSKVIYFTGPSKLSSTRQHLCVPFRSMSQDEETKNYLFSMLQNQSQFSLPQGYIIYTIFPFGFLYQRW